MSRRIDAELAAIRRDPNPIQLMLRVPGALIERMEGHDGPPSVQNERRLCDSFRTLGAQKCGRITQPHSTWVGRRPELERRQRTEDRTGWHYGV